MCGYVMTVVEQCVLGNVGMPDYMRVDDGIAEWSGMFQMCELDEVHLIAQFWSSSGYFLALFSVLYRVTSKTVYLHHSVAVLPFVLLLNSFPKYQRYVDHLH